MMAHRSAKARAVTARRCWSLVTVGLLIGGCAHSANRRDAVGKSGSPAVVAPRAAADAGAAAIRARGGSRPVATYSIVARDAETGDLGVAVQSHWFNVGPLVPWARSGVGAVATQSFVEASYGELSLDMLEAGRSPQQIIKGLTAADPSPDVRQVAVLSARGDVAAHTGKKCIPAAGHRVGNNYSVQANLMEKDTVWPKMAEAFEAAPGDLAERMLIALEAAENEGGDIRGRQSAALLVVRAESTGRSWEDRLVDLRVEDHPQPLVELRRLLRLHRAYEQMNKGDAFMAAGDTAAALNAYSQAEQLAPEAYEIPFWVAVTLCQTGRVEEALPRFKAAFEKEPRLRELVQRLPAVDLFPKDEELIKKVTEMP